MVVRMAVMPGILFAFIHGCFRHFPFRHVVGAWGPEVFERIASRGAGRVGQGGRKSGCACYAE
ncbi:hypothetical protein IZ6_28090 [Terrihabitans soli]|uniref:Uncharacterized protein n=1 Tax=Terrihabitans soli TaxID=708113 RepID=A0A6S6QNH9_9HYPH|nr:hypothetical protein IZ6_28090 [Terrihabitans soli]